MMRNRLFVLGSLIVALLVPVLSGSCQSSDPGQGLEIKHTTGPGNGLEDPAELRLAEREQMVEEQIIRRGVKDPAVLAAMRNVPRHEFVLDIYLSQAYGDHPLPIGYGQTISQPYIVALMTEAISLGEGDRVLEIGTGSGYQAAILAEMDAQVYTVEIIPELAQAAEARLLDLGYTNIEIMNADGYYGWEDQAPFDAVIVTAAPDHLPQMLIQQLSEGGRMVIPIGPVGAVQTLWLFESSGGELTALNLGLVSFVPLTGEH
jgi:protein-L-isoaspartate(D-aspartate) O-methyltransferase